MSYSNKLSIAGAVLLACGFTSVTQAQLTLDFSSESGVTLGTGTSVDSWASSVNSITVSSGATKPTLLNNVTPSGKDAIHFASPQSGTLVNDWLTASGIQSSTLFPSGASTTFFVLRPVNRDGTSFLSWDVDNNNLFQAAQNAGAGVFHSGSGEFTSAALPGNWADNWHVVTFIRNGASGDIRVDGTSIGGGTGLTDLSGSGLLGIAGLRSGDRFGGDIAAIQIQQGALSGAALTAAEASLTSTYLTPVPEPSQYATVFALACVGGALVVRRRRQNAVAS